ncbi:MAG: transcriptional regulator [Flavobacteriaceae bacterium]|nr:MAG: transcriptional regulator [Flavobacteriaceae bacterium]
MRITETGIIELDGIDKIILNAMMDDAKAPVAQIAREVGVSSTAIHQRIKKLDESGLIESTKTYINPKKLGYTTIAYVGVFLDKSSQYTSVVSSLKELPEVVECHFTTGNYALFIKILCKNNDHLMHILNVGIQQIEGVNRTETFISLEQGIQRQVKL